MPVARSRFLDPRVLAAVRDLPLVARTVAEGFLAGEHPSPRIGPGIEFSQYRSYQPGDDPRRVDWKLHARTDRFYVRESEVEQDVTVRLVLDATASMAHAEEGVSKFDVARVLAASLAWLAAAQGDRLALHAVGEGGAAATLPPARGLLALLDALERLEPGGRWPAGWPRPEVAGRRGRELVAVVSDLHQRESEVLEAAETFRRLGHEVLVFHLLGGREADFSWSGDLEFEDLETGETVRGHAEELRAGYLERSEAAHRAARSRLAGEGIDYRLVRCDRPLDAALRAFLVRRRAAP